MSFLLSLLTICTTIQKILSDQPYYQILEDFSFDLRKSQEKKIFYKNYVREGNIILDKNYITMNSKMYDSYGMFYSIKPILSNNFQVQLRMSQTFEHLRGSVLAIFFFENDLSDIQDYPGIENRSYLGFIDNFRGLSVEFITSGEGPLVQMTLVRAQMHDGKTKKSLNNMHKRLIDESCQTHKFKNETKNIWIELNKGLLSIKINDKKFLLENCLGVFNAKNLNPPFRIAVATINQGLDNQLYLDAPKLQKLIVFNTILNNKNNYTLFPNDDFTEEKLNKENYPLLSKEKYNKLKNEIFSTIKNYKKGYYGEGGKNFQNVFSIQNLNRSNMNKSELYNKIFKLDLIENSLNDEFMDEIIKRNKLENNEDIEFYLSKRKKLKHDVIDPKFNSINDLNIKLEAYLIINEKLHDVKKNLEEITIILMNKNIEKKLEINENQEEKFILNKEKINNELIIINSEVEKKSKEISDNLKNLKISLEANNFHNAIGSVNELYSDFNLELIFKKLNEFKNLMGEVFDKDDYINFFKTINSSLEELITNLKRAEENDLFLLINLREYVKIKANNFENYQLNRNMKIKLILTISIINIVFVIMIFTKLRKKVNKSRTV